MNVLIEIERKSNGRLGPKESSHTLGIRTKVHERDMVTFKFVGAAKSPTIKFTGPMSPFRGEVTYGDAHEVVGTPSPTVFTYDCSAEIDGKPVSTNGGGEMVIITG